MARASEQKRWRRITDRQRIEVYLPKDTVAALDKLAGERGASRAAVIASLTERSGAWQTEQGHVAAALHATRSEAAQGHDNAAKVKASTDTSEDENSAATDSGTTDLEPPHRSSADEPMGMPGYRGYRLRKPEHADEQHYSWIVMVDSKPIAGLERNGVFGWRGRYLKPSIYRRWVQRQRRDEVVAELLNAPGIYR